MKLVTAFASLLFASATAVAADKDARAFASQLPSIFWYCAELYGKSGGTSTRVSHAEFTRTTKAAVEQKVAGAGAKEDWAFKMVDSENNFSHWRFVFSFDGKKWSAVEGQVRFRGSSIDLYKQQFGSPSMRPHMDNALAAYNSGKLQQHLQDKSSVPQTKPAPPTISSIDSGPTPPQKYELLIGEGLAGSGFVIRHNNTLFGVCSLHQFAGKAPATLEPLDGEAIHLDRTKVFRQHDVQVIPVKSPRAKLQFLAYNADFTLRPGEDVIILAPDGRTVHGVLTPNGMTAGSYKSSQGPCNLQVRASEPFAAAGGSGAPIIQKRTGAVVGVLLTADHGERARSIGFETLCLRK